jgi:SAM-dependent methyltransferase
MIQTPSERHLVAELVRILKEHEGERLAPRILNIGAGSSVVLEDQISEAGCRFVCDRLDVEECTVRHSNVDRCWKCSVESMDPVPSGIYRAALANFVLEHVQEIEKAAREIHRVLAPSGRFVASLPNPSSPVGLLTRLTPLWLHKLVRRSQTWETAYAFKTIAELSTVFEACGLAAVETTYDPFVESYLHALPILRTAARGCDRAVARLGARGLMTHVCVVFEKKS